MRKDLWGNPIPDDECPICGPGGHCPPRNDTVTVTISREDAERWAIGTHRADRLARIAEACREALKETE